MSQKMTSLPPAFRAVVVGASGGIGGAVAAELINDDNCAALYALSRSGTGGPAGAFRIAADVTNPDSLARAAQQIGDEGPIDLIFIASGLLHRGSAILPEKSWRSMSPAAFAELFAVNSSGPMLAIGALLPHVRRDQRALIAVIGARVGSIDDNRLGGWYAYRASKAALAMLIRTLSIELARTHPELVALMLHPGTVDSPLSKPFQRGVAQLLTPQVSAAAMLRVLDRATSEQSGQQLSWQGELIAP